MVKEITNLFINSKIAINNSEATTGNSRIYSININVPPIIIKKKSKFKSC